MATNGNENDRIDGMVGSDFPVGGKNQQSSSSMISFGLWEDLPLIMTHRHEFDIVMLIDRDVRDGVRVAHYLQLLRWSPSNREPIRSWFHGRQKVGRCA